MFLLFLSSKCNCVSDVNKHEKSKMPPGVARPSGELLSDLFTDAPVYNVLCVMCCAPCVSCVFVSCVTWWFVLCNVLCLLCRV